ncbi:transporter substrate-binding domain-containing protein [Ferrovibrio xuzhouensis]|uniref:Transporter substrate-binding domain-containing protein n=1 Tax=Ferrovibrio xuzhouensis TaxID=1576914 RepID=A0ABV7VMP6_9PROT
MKWSKACLTLTAGLSLMLSLAGFTRMASADTLDDIKARGVLIVGGKTDYKPFGYREAGGPVVGFAVELANRVAEKLGVKVEIVPTAAANQLQFLEQGKIDVLIAAMNDTPERRKIVRIIEPGYYASGANLLVIKAAAIKSWSSIKGKPICANQGAYFNRPVEENYGAKIVAFKSPTEAYNALRNGSCIGFVYDDNSLTLKLDDPDWNAYEMPLKSIMPQPVAMAVRLGDERLAKILTDLSVEWYRTGYIRQLEKKWFPGKDSSFVEEMAAKYK